MAQFATIQQYAKRKGFNERSLRQWIGEGLFPVYRLHGIKGVVVKIDEADAALVGKQTRGWGNFGPKAVIRDLRMVVMDAEVDQ